MKYIKELDSLRALAILSVILGHWAPGFFLNKIPWGGIGVHFFFVLSGFLITKILLESRINSEGTNVSNSSLIKNFYLRRSLRIFPIYYLTIFLLLIFRKYANINFHSAFIYCITYTTNFYFFKIGSWDGQISHLWTLAVEEQFYFIWPWIIILIQKKYLKHVIISFIILGVLSEYIFDKMPMGLVLSNTCFAGFGLGALLAWQTTFKENSIRKFYLWITVFAIIATILFVAILMFPQAHIPVPMRFITFLISIWLLTYVILYAETDKLKFRIIFNNRILIFVGKISYGMYLYHFIIPSLLNTNLINKYVNPHFPYFIYVIHFRWLFFLENMSLLILISWLSYIFIEKKFLNFKKYFNA